MDGEEPPRTLREKKKLARRQRIIDESIRLFSEKGYEGTSIDDIAEAADISRATFFNYFEGKSHLILHFRHKYNSGYYDIVFDHVDPDKPCRENVFIACKVRAEYAHASPAFTKECIPDIHQESELEMSDRMRFAGVFRTLLQWGVERGEVKRDIDLDQLSRILSGMYFYAGDWWMLTGDTKLYRPLEYIASMIDLLWKGVAAE